MKEGWIGKKVFVVLQNGQQFTGIIEEVNEVGDRLMFLILDKFNKHVGFLDSEISMIKEERE